MTDSPQLAILEAITCGLILIFYFWHSWHYDRLKPMFCRKIIKSTESNLDSKNSFHLLMRFIYLICLPIYMVQSIMVAYINYQVVYIPVEMEGFPVNYTSSPQSHTNLVYVIYYLKALGWSGEGIVHLEELAFWIFLLHLKDKSPPWFKSGFFQAFVLLSAISSATLLCIVSAFKSNVGLAVMMTFATGYNFTITCAFFWVLVKFPGWLRELRNRGAPAELIIRLHGFGTLNQIRMVFRLIFLAPLLALSMDGLMPQPFLNKYVLIVDLIAISSTLAFAAQAVITLLIFLPRDLRSECGYDAEETKSRFETTEQPLLSQSLEGLCFTNSHSNFIQQPLCDSPWPQDNSGSRATSLNEKHRNLSIIPNAIQPIRRNGSRLTSSQLDSVSQISKSHKQFSSLHEQELHAPSFQPSETAACFSQRTSRGATEMTEFNFALKLLEVGSTNQSENFLQSSKESTSHTQLGHPVSFPISSPVTHFPRYFAPSERRGQVSDAPDGATSFCTLSRPPSLQQEQICSIHPAIRNFKSPIDIQNISLLDIEINSKDQGQFLSENSEN